MEKVKSFQQLVVNQPHIHMEKNASQLLLHKSWPKIEKCKTQTYKTSRRKQDKVYANVSGWNLLRWHHKKHYTLQEKSGHLDLMKVEIFSFWNDRVCDFWVIITVLVPLPGWEVITTVPGILNTFLLLKLGKTKHNRQTWGWRLSVCPNLLELRATAVHVLGSDPGSPRPAASPLPGPHFSFYKASHAWVAFMGEKCVQQRLLVLRAMWVFRRFGNARKPPRVWGCVLFLFF